MVINFENITRLKNISFLCVTFLKKFECVISLSCKLYVSKKLFDRKIVPLAPLTKVCKFGNVDVVTDVE